MRIEVNRDDNGEADGMNLEVDSKDEVMHNLTRTVLTRRVSSYGLPAWVSSELGPMGGGAQPLQRPQQHWNRVTTK